MSKNIMKKSLKKLSEKSFSYKKAFLEAYFLKLWK